MTQHTNYLDCCETPILETVKRFASTDTGMIAIRRCQNCRCQWFYCLEEDLRELGLFRGDSDPNKYDRQIWYVRLADDEAAALVEAEATPDPNLFAERSGFLMDADGMTRIVGVPKFMRRKDA